MLNSKHAFSYVKYMRFIMIEHSNLLVGVEDTFQGCKCSTYVT